MKRETMEGMKEIKDRKSKEECRGESKMRFNEKVREAEGWRKQADAEVGSKGRGEEEEEGETGVSQKGGGD